MEVPRLRGTNHRSGTTEVNASRHLIAATETRFAVVDHEKSWLKTPLNWRVRIYGQGIGGYAPADGKVTRHARKADAERTAQVWMSDGIYPAQQTPHPRNEA
jgi:hypothetical protein